MDWTCWKFFRFYYTIDALSYIIDEKDETHAVDAYFADVLVSAWF